MLGMRKIPKHILLFGHYFSLLQITESKNDTKKAVFFSFLRSHCTHFHQNCNNAVRSGGTFFSSFKTIFGLIQIIIGLGESCFSGLKQYCGILKVLCYPI